MFVKKLVVFSGFEFPNLGLKDHKLNDKLPTEEVLV